MGLKVTQDQINETKDLIPEDLSLLELRHKFKKVKGRETTLDDDKLIIAQAATDDDDDELLSANILLVEEGDYEIAA